MEDKEDTKTEPTTEDSSKNQKKIKILFIVGIVLLACGGAATIAVIVFFVIKEAQKGKKLKDTKELVNELVDGTSFSCEAYGCKDINNDENIDDVFKTRTAHCIESGCKGDKCKYCIVQVLCDEGIIDCTDLKKCTEYMCEPSEDNECFACINNERCCHVKDEEGCINCKM
jgi:hypothetical protein